MRGLGPRSHVTIVSESEVRQQSPAVSFHQRKDSSCSSSATCRVSQCNVSCCTVATVQDIGGWRGCWQVRAGNGRVARAGMRSTRVESSGFESNPRTVKSSFQVPDNRADAQQSLAGRERPCGRAPPKALRVLEISHQDGW